MTNKRYEKGARKERKVVNDCRRAGLIAFRSAGSHSPIDVCVIDTKERVVRFIKSKSGDFSQKERERLLEKYSQLNGGFHCRFEVL